MKITLKTVICCLSLILTTVGFSYGQTLTTDKPDYAPLSTAIFTGTGFGANETVALTVYNITNPVCYNGLCCPYYVTADANGDFTMSWTVCNCPWNSLMATATGQTTNLMATAYFTDGPNGTGVVTDVSPVGGECVGYTPASGSGPDNWEVQQGGTYTMTITGVTECTGNTITVFVQNSNTGNFCFDATGGGGTYSGNFTMPNPGCHTFPISYKCGAGQTCDNANTYNADGPSNNNTVHLRAATFSNACASFVTDDNCNPDCIPVAITGCTPGSDLGCNPLLMPSIAPTFTGTNASVSGPSDDITNVGCTYTLTRTWTVTGDCGGPLTCVQIYTYTQANDLAFDNLPEGGYIGCNPVPPSCEAVTASNACGTVNATCTPGTITSAGCTYSQTFTYHASTTCGGDADEDVTYTWTVATAPVFANLPIGGPLGCNPPTLPSCSTVPGNLVINGDFEEGNSDFLSEYLYVSDPGSQNGLWPEGTYAITTDASIYHSLFYGLGHSGNFMVVNGAVSSGILVWQQTVSVTPNTDYYFATWVSNVDGPPPSNLNFSINGTQIGSTFNAPASNYEWSQFYQTWNSGANTTAIIAIVNLNTTYGGNDFGLDDITFSVQSPVASASNECGNVPVTCSAGPVISNGCERSQTITYTAEAACGGTSSEDVVYTWTVSGDDLVITPGGSTNVCSGSCVQLWATEGYSGYQWYLNGVAIDGETESSTAACEQGEYSVTASNSCGCSSTSEPVTVNVFETPSCNIDQIDDLDFPVANTDNNQLCAETSGGANLTYAWSLTSSDGSWSIQGPADGLCVNYHCGTFGSSATFTFTVTANYGNGITCTSDVCSITLTTEAHEQCSYTQGFYGQVNGEVSCTGASAPMAIAQALTSGNIVLGNPTGTKRLTITPADVNCVTLRLPGGSTAAALTAKSPAGWSCSNFSPLQGTKFKNVLVGQTLTLAINLRLYPDLGNYHLTSPTYTTYDAYDCDPETDDMIPGSGQTFTIPAAVISCLGPGSTNNTVTKLLALANRALGGQPLGCVSGAATIQQINDAVDAVNRGFDKCRLISGYNIREASQTVSGTGEFSFTYQPNPTNGITKATFIAPADGNATMEVYNLAGALVRSVYSENVSEGNIYTAEFDASQFTEGVYFIRTTVGNSTAHGKLVIVK